jgi:hypothetical protein
LIKNERAALADQPFGFIGLDQSMRQFTAAARAKTKLDMTVAVRLMVLLMV